jgi:hypothetical protein
MIQPIRVIQLAACGALALGCAPATPFGHVSRPVSHKMTQSTPDAPRLKRLPNGHYRVTRPWTVIVNGEEWHVQKGYQSNGITAPSLIKESLGDGIDHPETWAAVFHDWLFTQPGMTRIHADQTFHQLLLAYGVSSTKAELMYSSVRAYSLKKGVP